MAEKTNWTRDTFSQLYNEHYRGLSVYAANFVGNLSEAEDIVQEVFSTLWEHDLSFISSTAIKAYLYRSVRNGSLDMLKHKNVEESYIHKTMEAYPEIKFDDSGDTLNKEIVYAKLFRTIEDLPQRQREIFLLYMRGKKNREIAEIMQVSVDTVKTQKRRAMSFLRQKLGSKEYEMLVFLLLNSISI